MSFVTPILAIAGLIGISIPIIIHLLSRRRRKPVEWAAMRFLLEAYKKHRRRLQIEQLILLAVRCLIIALIGGALARPVLENLGIVDLGGSRVVFLVIDDGIAAGVTDEAGTPAMERTVEQAVDIVRALDPGDVVGVVTAGRPARGVLVPPSTDHGSVIDLLRGMAASESATDIPAAIELTRAAIEDLDANAGQVLVYLLSEFREGSAALDAPLPTSFEDLADRVSLFATPPAEQSASNIQIASIEPVRNVVLTGQRDGSGQTTVRLKRSGVNLDADVTRVSLSTDGSTVLEQQVVRWQPGEREVSVEFILDGIDAGQREIGVTGRIDDDALRGDNVRHTVLELRDRIRVLLVDRRSFGFEPTIDKLTAGQWIRRAIEPDTNSPLEIVEVEPGVLDIPDVRVADVVVIARPDLMIASGWDVLSGFVDAGGMVLVVPPGEPNVHRWTETMVSTLRLPWRIELEVDDIPGGELLADEQPVSELLRMLASELNDLCGPVRVNRMLPIDTTQTRAESILTTTSGQPVMIAGAPEVTTEGESESGLTRGLVVYLATAPQLDWTNLPSQPLMVPLVHETIRQGLGLTRGGQSYRVGERPAIVAVSTARDLVDQSGNEVALDSSLRPEEPLRHSGLFDIRDGAGQLLGLVGVNIDPNAARVDAQSAAAVDQWLAASGAWRTIDADDVGAALRASRSRSPVAFYVLMALLALIILETALARWFSHAFQFGKRTVLRPGDTASVLRSTTGGAA